MIEKIILGTAQFGMKYPADSKIKEPEVRKILDYAFESGIRMLDTARCYGDSEKLIGKYNDGRFDVISKYKDEKDYEISRSLLGKQLKLYLAHGFEYYRKINFEKCDGVSLENPYEILCVITNPRKDVMAAELPYNILKRENGFYFPLIKRVFKKLIVRSVFRRGDLLKLYFIRDCLGFILHDPCVDFVVIGVDGLDQLKQIVGEIKCWQ